MAEAVRVFLKGCGCPRNKGPAKPKDRPDLPALAFDMQSSKNYCWAPGWDGNHEAAHRPSQDTIPREATHRILLTVDDATTIFHLNSKF